MSKGFKKVLQSNKKALLAHLICLGILLLGFVLCRYVFFDLHGMKEWPVDLLIAGLTALLISLFARKQYVPWFTAGGYVFGFLLGVLFHTEGTDLGGGKTNNLWIIWTVVFAVCILAGGVIEILLRWARRLKVFTS